MLDLIILGLMVLVFTANFLADKNLENYFLDFDFIYFEFLELEQIKQTEKKKQEKKIKFVLETIKTKKIIIDINIKNMIKIEQKLKTYKKIINNTSSSSYEIWLAEGSRIKLKTQWQERYKHNLRLSAEIKNYKNL